MMKERCYNYVRNDGRYAKMKEQNRTRLKSGIKGSLLCFVFCSISYSLSAIIFSEMKNVVMATVATLILSLISAATYLILEKAVFLKTKSSAFAIGYFGTLALASAMVFFVTSIFPMNYIFDLSAYHTAVYFRQSTILLCSFNAAALVIRLGFETGKYVSSVLKQED